MFRALLSPIFRSTKQLLTTASGNRYTVIDRVKFTDEEYQQTRLKLQLLNNVYSAKNAISSVE
jgi:hypothetical protein